MNLSFSQLPFGNLHKRAALKSTTSLAPISATNIVTSPAGAAAADPKAGPKTPLDMGIPAQSPADQSPTEQALGASADDLKLRDDHAKLQADHQKLQQQMDTAKQQAQLAKANKPAPAAAPKNDSMGKYKSMSMQLMGAHLDRVKQNLKGVSEAGGPGQVATHARCLEVYLDSAEEVRGGRITTSTRSRHGDKGLPCPASGD